MDNKWIIKSLAKNTNGQNALEAKVKFIACFYYKKKRVDRFYKILYKISICITQW